MSGERPRALKLKIEVPPGLDAIYANLVVISHSPSEVIMDFAQVLPNTSSARVQTRVVTTPPHAKLVLRALQQNLERYEAQYGEIRLPPSGDDLAREFFGGAKPPE